jgi:hypothetical protein
MRDANPSLLVAPSSNPLIKRFRNIYADCHVAFVKTIRVRAMAIRTEQTYEHWITRFLKFHKWKSIDELGSAVTHQACPQAHIEEGVVLVRNAWRVTRTTLTRPTSISDKHSHE